MAEKIQFVFKGGKRGRSSVSRDFVLAQGYAYAVAVKGEMTSENLKSEGRKFGISYSRIANVLGGGGKGAFARGREVLVKHCESQKAAPTAKMLPEAQWLGDKGE